MPERLAFEQVAGIAACLGLALLAHAASLPLWVLGTVAVCAAIRLYLAYRGGGNPPRSVLLIVSCTGLALLFLRFHTFNGLAAGTALLSLMAGLKLLETQAKRDIYVVTLCIYFLSTAALLESESFWLLTYLLAVYWLTTATLLRVTTRHSPPDWRRSLRYGGRILTQALPLALVFWVLFPRFAAPLWQLPAGNHEAETGLGDSMSPGDITELARSDEVAFRVHFSGAVPPPRDRYWRGPVLHEFDGRTWRRVYTAAVHPPPLQMQGPAYRYTLNLEPHQHTWIFALDWPSSWDLPRGFLSADYTLLQPYPVSTPIDVAATSFTRVSSQEPLDEQLRFRDTQFAPSRNPRTQQLALELRRAHPDDMAFVQAVLDRFNQEEFYYTLTPPALGENSVDQFLFDVRRGFCGHYASAFAVLARAAGIPTRVVTGYQGGEYNRFADYWIVRQSNAHAWDEVWIAERGWVRVDPTSAISPSRVEHSVNDAVGADQPLAAHWQPRSSWLGDARLRLDALRELWRERILTFNQNSQDRLLQMLHIPEPDGQKLVMLLAASLSVALVWLTWQVRRELDPAPADPVVRAYRRLCAKLAAAGLRRIPHEGAEAYAARVAAARPDLAVTVTGLCRRYNALRYSPATAPLHAAAAQFAADVRKFTPRGSRGSS